MRDSEILFDQLVVGLVKYRGQLIVNDLYWPTLNGTKTT